MSKATQGVDKLPLPQKLSRLRVRLGSDEWRRYGMLLLAGKALGLAVLFAMILAGTTLIRSA